MTDTIQLTYFSDVLCIWAHIAQARLDQVDKTFTGQVAIEYRFCSVFGDVGHKIGLGWASKGGYDGFASHLQEIAAGYDHISLHPSLWHTCRPVSSTPAHLVLKAVQRLDPSKCRKVLLALRRAFFEYAKDISCWTVLSEALTTAGVDCARVRDLLDRGLAHADLESDQRERQSLMVQGSPTLVLNEGRQKLYGNVGFRVIEANINELLRSPSAGAASWC